MFNASLSCYDTKLFAHIGNKFIPAFGKQRLVINEPHLKSYPKVPFINLSNAIALYTKRVNEKKKDSRIFSYIFPYIFSIKFSLKMVISSEGFCIVRVMSSAGVEAINHLRAILSLLSDYVLRWRKFIQAAIYFS